MRFVEPAELDQGASETRLELRHQVALRSEGHRLLERRQELALRRGSVTPVERELAQELARQHLLAPRSAPRGERQRPLEMILGALELAPAAAHHPDREQRHRLAHRMPDLARDLERLPEILLGEIPLPEPVADQAEVLIVAPHPGVEAGTLVEAQRLLDVAGGLAPFAQVLVDQSEIVQRRHQALGIVDAPERRGGALQPVDRFLALSEPRAAQAERDRHLADDEMLIGVAQHPVGIERVAAAAAIPALIDEDVRIAGGKARVPARIHQHPRSGPRFGEGEERRVEITTAPMGLGQSLQQPATLGGHFGPEFEQCRNVFLGGPCEVVGRQV